MISRSAKPRMYARILGDGAGKSNCEFFATVHDRGSRRPWRRYTSRPAVSSILAERGRTMSTRFVPACGIESTGPCRCRRRNQLRLGCIARRPGEMALASSPRTGTHSNRGIAPHGDRKLRSGREHEAADRRASNAGRTHSLVLKCLRHKRVPLTARLQARASATGRSQAPGDKAAPALAGQPIHPGEADKQASGQERLLAY